MFFLYVNIFHTFTLADANRPLATLVCRGNRERVEHGPEQVPKPSHLIHMSLITGRRNKQAGCAQNTKWLPQTPAVGALNQISKTTSS